jgi:sigma-B regulation protein RsbU (phosphoserine phosphatase)
MSAPHAEFAREFDAETGVLLRHRFWWYLGSISALYILFRSVWLIVYAALQTSRAAGHGMEMVAESAMDNIRFGHLGAVIVGALTVLDVGALVWFGVRARRRPYPAQQLLLTQGLLVFLGSTHIAAMVLLNSPGFPWVIMFYHMVACLFLPWTPLQALRPIVPLVIANAAAVLLFRTNWELSSRTIVVITSLLAIFPGLFIAWVRHTHRASTFGTRMLQARYGQMRRELYDARRIHEALFPRPIPDGPLRFEYRYLPMLQIGGDYLYARFSPPREPDQAPPFNLLLMDVTGHGIAAALTVNRLYGEVERLFAEDPHAGPGDVLVALNRYVHLTLATHSIYVTALCIRIDQEAGRLEYASGGHPPAFLCSASGHMDQLDSTSFVLGAAAGADFQPAVQVRDFAPGDTLLAYTDGALECRNQAGKMLGVKGLAGLIETTLKSDGPARRALAAALLGAVDKYRYGPPEDDTLIVEIARSAAAATSAPTLRVDTRQERRTISV